MKTAVAALLTCAALCCAQETKPEAQPKQQEVKRLESVTWDLSTHKLVWLVAKGVVIDGEFVPQKKVKYEVSPDEAFMALAEDKKSINVTEAAALHQLLDMLSMYCVESVVWWDKGAPDYSSDDESATPGLVTKPERKPQQPKPVPVPLGAPVRVRV